MTDVIIYKKIEVTIIRPSKEYIWVQSEKAQQNPACCICIAALSRFLSALLKEVPGCLTPSSDTATYQFS